VLEQEHQQGAPLSLSELQVLSELGRERRATTGESALAPVGRRVPRPRHICRLCPGPGFEPLQQEQIVLQYVDAHGEITRAQAADLCSTTPRPSESSAPQTGQPRRARQARRASMEHPWPPLIAARSADTPIPTAVTSTRGSADPESRGVGDKPFLTHLVDDCSSLHDVFAHRQEHARRTIRSSNRPSDWTSPDDWCPTCSATATASTARPCRRHRWWPERNDGERRPPGGRSRPHPPPLIRG